MDCGLDGLTFTQPSLTKPQFADECSIGNIVKRFIRTGELPQMRQRPTIADATSIPDDFFEAIRPAVEVRQAFDQQPLEVRNKYNNDPELWYADEVNRRYNPPKEVVEKVVEKGVEKDAPKEKQDVLEQIEQTKASSSASQVSE